MSFAAKLWSHTRLFPCSVRCNQRVLLDSPYWCGKFSPHCARGEQLPVSQPGRGIKSGRRASKMAQQSGASPGPKPKLTIAIEGCCHGELDNIYGTLQHLERTENKKIDLLICCGDFQVCIPGVRDTAPQGSLYRAVANAYYCMHYYFVHCHFLCMLLAGDCQYWEVHRAAESTAAP